jgi:hypothetical protein
VPGNGRLPAPQNQITADCIGIDLRRRELSAFSSLFLANG